MGMDIYGRKPKNESGKYFRASCWSWRPLGALCTSLIELHKPDLSYMPVHWQSNDGDGFKNQKDCNKLADLIDDFLKTFHGNRMQEKPVDRFMVNANGRFLRDDEIDSCPTAQSPYGINKEHIQEFVTFLRNCGGFKIW